MPTERPFLTASWTELLMLNFAVPGDVIARLAPPGTEPDFFDGQAYVSIVGFMFRDARFFGIRFPGHRRFEEVNLRYYVRREVGDTMRQGVVFVREIAPRPLVAAMARWVYNESYVTRRMRNSVRLAGSTLAAGDEIGYEWRTGRGAKRRWNRMAGRAAAAPHLPAPGSLTEYIVEHYWAYVRTRDGGTSEYRVAHRPWRVAPAEDVVWDCDLAASYEHTPLAEYLGGAAGAGVRRRRLAGASLSRPALRGSTEPTSPSPLGSSNLISLRRFPSDELVNERQLFHDFVRDHFRHQVFEPHRAVDFVEEHAELLIGLGERFDGQRFRIGRETGQMVVHRREHFPHVEIEAPGLGEIFPGMGGRRRR